MPVALLRHKHAESVSSFSTRLKSLRSIPNADWVSLIEPLIVFDAVLRQDPAGAYEKMDFESRQTLSQSHRTRSLAIPIHRTRGGASRA